MDVQQRDIIIDFLDSYIEIKALTEKGLNYLKHHWKKRKLCFGKIKYVKHFNTERFKQYQLNWAILSNCTATKEIVSWDY